MPDREQLLQETARAVVSYFELDPQRPYKPVIRELELSEQERKHYAHKPYVIIAD